MRAEENRLPASGDWSAARTFRKREALNRCNPQVSDPLVAADVVDILRLRAPLDASATIRYAGSGVRAAPMYEALLAARIVRQGPSDVARAVTAIDASQEMIEIYKQKVADSRVEYQRAAYSNGRKDDSMALSFSRSNLQDLRSSHDFALLG